MILEKRAARLIKHPWSLRLGGGVETPLMPGVRSKRCRQARPLTGWVDSQSESDRGSVTLINAETPVALMSVTDRKSTRLNSSHTVISYAVFCLKKQTT